MSILQLTKAMLILSLITIFALLTLIITFMVFLTMMKFYIKIVLIVALTAMIYFMFEICQDAIKLLFYDDQS